MNLYQQMNVTEAVCRSYLPLFLYLTLSGAVLLFAGLLRWKVLGLYLDGALMLAGAGLVLLHSDSMWLFPCAHALTWSHYTECFEAPVAPFWCSVAYWGIGILLFSLGALLMIGGRDFDSTLEFDQGAGCDPTLSRLIDHQTVRDFERCPGGIHGLIGRNGRGYPPAV